MADAITAQWHGHNYQSRYFWDNALDMLGTWSCAVEVTFEADGPKSFDDVVVKYDPPLARSGPDGVSAEYHQVKWHVGIDGRFGYEDFVDPDFIGATSFSLLERLRNAKETAPDNACFSFVTTYKIKDNDQLAELVSGNDRSLLVENLFRTKTDNSHMGKVRKLWREHLKLASDDELRAVVSRLRIIQNSPSMDALRTQVNIKAAVVGLIAVHDSNSVFHFDELARQLKIRGMNSLTKATLQKLCKDENLFAPIKSVQEHFLPIAIRSFLGLAAEVAGASAENTLFLTDSFRMRYLHDDFDWQKDIRPRVESFLKAAVKKSSALRLILDAHASIAFLAGAIYDLKSGVDLELVQKGRAGTSIWTASDGSGTNAAAFTIEAEFLGAGSEVALAIGITQPVQPQTKAYVSASLPNVGQIISFTLPSGPGQQTVAGGGHAAALAERVSNSVREIKAQNPDAVIHIFAACPNTFLFFLGQNHQSISPAIVYEFDFDRKGNKSYQPSFLIE